MIDVSDGAQGPGERLEGASVLVTGAGGFIGRHLVRRLAGEGARVHEIVRRPNDPPREGVRRLIGDLSDLGFVEDTVRRVQPAVIFHLASTVVGARDQAWVMPTLRDNLVTTVNLLHAATDVGGARLVLAGSLEEPDPGSSAVSSSPYAASKRAATDYARMFHRLYGTAVSVARIFMVYGPDQQDLRKLVPYVTLSLLRNETPALSSGTRAVDWVYVDDVVDGLVRLALSPCVDGTPVDIGSGELHTVREVVDLLVRIANPRITPRFGAQPDRPDEQVRRADLQAAYDAIGWKPAVSLPEGLERTVRWYDQASRSNRPDQAPA